jgi:hypothetical protein
MKVICMLVINIYIYSRFGKDVIVCVVLDNNV